MFEATISPLDLALTAGSGQCFRMAMLSQDVCRVVAGHRCVTVRTLGGGRFLFSCDEAEYRTFWAGFFDADTDYDGLLPAAHDAYAQAAVRYARGVRILRQQPWEALISFILSQRRSIPAIRLCVDRLCRAYGRPVADGVCAFPTPRALADAPPDGLAACSLGYRAPYVSQTARLVASGEVSLDALDALPDDALASALQRLPGVGPKVAACVMLFGYHRLNAFPVDVWIDRVLRDQYGGQFPRELYAPCAGVIQQYLFVYARSRPDAR